MSVISFILAKIYNIKDPVGFLQKSEGLVVMFSSNMLESTCIKLNEYERNFFFWNF